MNVYFLKTSLDVKEVLEKLARFKGHAIVLRPEIAALKKALDYSYFLAYKSFSEGRASARKFELEWISKLAATSNITSALKLCLPRGKEIAVASDLPLDKRTLAAVGKPFKPALGKAKLGGLAREYGLTHAALKNYALEDLVVEKIAVAEAG
jgi:tRNA threonylcarbamoyladenosine modification (KEOPS) complex Cgi121 subunit